jgi:hypothetical protein
MPRCSCSSWYPCIKLCLCSFCDECIYVYERVLKQGGGWGKNWQGSLAALADYLLRLRLLGPDRVSSAASCL